MDNFKMVLEMDFLRKVKAFTTLPTLNGYCRGGESIHGPYGHRGFSQDPYVIGYANKEGVKEERGDLPGYP